MWKFLRRGKEDRIQSSDVQLLRLPEAGVEGEREAISQIAADGSSKFGHGVVDESGKLLRIVCCHKQTLDDGVIRMGLRSAAPLHGAIRISF